MPDETISANAIAGFLGKTEAQFANTLKLMTDIVFNRTNTAAYSPRPVTPAALWDNQLNEEVKGDRLQRLNHLVSVQAEMRNQRYLHRVEEWLVEDQNPKTLTQ